MIETIPELRARFREEARRAAIIAKFVKVKLGDRPSDLARLPETDLQVIHQFAGGSAKLWRSPRKKRTG